MMKPTEPTQEQVDREMDLGLRVTEAIAAYCRASKEAPTLKDAEIVARIVSDAAATFREEVIIGSSQREN